LLEKRRILLNDWENHCSTISQSNVLLMKAA